MVKITFLGAGSIVFGEQVLTDILTFPELRKELVICLEDIDPKRLNLAFKYMERYKEAYPEELKGVRFEKTTNQEEALNEAKYIICAIQIGGDDAVKFDLDIPFKYGITQSVGDTLGPGGVFRFLRTFPIMKSIIEQIRNISYASNSGKFKPLLLNYTNPMAMITWYCNLIVPNSTVGLCHGIQHTANMLRRWIGVNEDDFSFFCAGINHMAWFLELWYKNSKTSKQIWQNAYPLLFKILEDNPEKTYNTEKLRCDMMKATGYYMTESSGHLSEYLPYYRKRKDLLEKYKSSSSLYGSLKHAEYLDLYTKIGEKIDIDFRRKLKKKPRIKEKPSEEYASHIINAIETNKPFIFNGNTINKEGGLITNLPKGCCVEVPISANSYGLHPQGGIELPTVCQALCLSNIMVQKAAVEAAITLDREKIYHAILLDPNTASVCSPMEIREMVDEMIKAEAKWLPNFQ